MDVLVTARERALTALPGTCTIITVVREATTTGGWTDTETEGATVACRVSRIRDRATEIPTGVKATALMAIYLPHGTACPAGARIEADGVTYPVLETTTDTWGVYTTAWCGGPA